MEDLVPAPCGWKYGFSIFDHMTNLADNLGIDDRCKDCFEVEDLGEADSD